MIVACKVHVMTRSCGIIEGRCSCSYGMWYLSNSSRHEQIVMNRLCGINGADVRVLMACGINEGRFSCSYGMW